jgi:hypothetical protein
MVPPQYVGAGGNFYPMYDSSHSQGMSMYPQYPPPYNPPGKLQPTLKRKSPAKPSQFRPQPSAHDYGEHNAENEEDVIAVIKEFEEKNNDESVLVGRMSSLAQTQTGSRFLQKQLNKANPLFISFILQEVSNAHHIVDRKEPAGTDGR